VSVYRIRNSLKTWIEGYINIQSWDLDVPPNIPRVLDVSVPPPAGSPPGTPATIEKKRFPSNCAIAMPILDFKSYRKDDQPHGQATFSFGLLFRFNTQNVAKHQLPLDKVELIVNFLAERACLFPKEISPDISNIETDSINEAVSIGRVSGEDGDWLLVAKPEFTIDFISRAQEDFEAEACLQPALGAIDPPITFTGLNLRVNRSDHPVTAEPGTFTLDLLMELPPNATP
jgi:hypothetical protein